MHDPIAVRNAMAVAKYPKLYEAADRTKALRVLADYIERVEVTLSDLDRRLLSMERWQAGEQKP